MASIYSPGGGGIFGGLGYEPVGWRTGEYDPLPGSFMDRWAPAGGMPAAVAPWNSPLFGGGDVMPPQAQPAGPQPAPPMQRPAAQGGNMPSALGPVPWNPLGIGRPGSPDIGDRLMAGLMGFTQSGNPIAGLGNLIGGLVTGEQGGPTRQTEDIKEYEYAKKQGFRGGFIDWMSAKRLAGAPKAGLQPIMDAEGNIFQLTSDGKLIKPEGAESFKINKGVEFKDIGTHLVPVYKATGQPAGEPIPKNLAAAAAQKALGGIQGTTAGNLPTDLLVAEQTVKEIDKLTASKGLDSIVGPIDQFRPSVMLGEEGRSALARYNQLKGRGFLQAYTTLKGGGQITEIEGQKAEQAMARMDRAQSEKDFREALGDFRQAVLDGVRKLKEKAGQVPTAPSATTPNVRRYNPETGKIE